MRARPKYREPSLEAHLLLIPVPLNGTVNGFSSGSVEGIIKVAVFPPMVVGLKRKSTVHDAPGVRVFLEHLSAALEN